MRRRRLLVPVVLGLAMSMAGCAQPRPHASRDDEAVLRAQAQAWDEAIVHKDRAAIEANMADDFRQIDARGHVEDKRSFVEGLIDPDLTIEPYTVEDFEIRRYGDVALLSGRTHMAGRYRGKAFRTHYRYIDIYVKRQGRWRIVSVQISPVVP